LGTVVLIPTLVFLRDLPKVSTSQTLAALMPDNCDSSRIDSDRPE